MSSILDIVQQHLGPQELAQISQQLGTDPGTTQQAVNAALPALVGGMASTAQQPGGAEGIQSLLGSHGGLLGSLGSILGGGGAADGGILGQVLGRHQPAVQDGVQQASGLGPDQTRKLLMMLAPIVMAALAKRAMNHGTAHENPADLNNVLQEDAVQAKQQAQSQSQHMGGLLGKILDHVESPEMRNRG
ncbi:MAG TPA: DUF937 domain-containing protein [Gemmatimonadaceae bacterium]|jgi:hypothetical protein|nr:DUF937 domain-containing protein [Gemmatimonadaceae bacterium]